MRMYCKGHKKVHSDHSWKTTWDEKNKIIHICSAFFRPSGPAEIVSQETKDARQEYAKSLIQPWRGGEPSAEFIRTYPKQAKGMFTAKERAKAKEVWKDTLPSNWEKTK